jgi:hypothetical protein
MKSVKLIKTIWFLNKVTKMNKNESIKDQVIYVVRCDF